MKSQYGDVAVETRGHVAVLTFSRPPNNHVSVESNFVKLGFHPGFGITYTLPRIVGEQRAALLCMTGRRINGEQALEWGLADVLAPLDRLLDAAVELAAEIAEAAPLAVQSTRATFRTGVAEAVKKQTDHELVEQSWLRKTKDFAEGVRAVNERRSGNFVGA
jgi:enoyl-CoA hydratase/carnithine racemase